MAGPPIVFFVPSGEETADVGQILYDNVAYQAVPFGAIVLLLEHRFYGSSVPNNDSSTENLRFLTSQQALADMVIFQAHIIDQYNLGEDSQWILVGGSYSGVLSAWARLKYPHLFVGSLAISAPLESRLDYYQYNEIVEASLGQECSSQIADAINTVTEMLNTAAGQAQLVHDFNICAPFSDENDIRLFMMELANPIEGAVQYAGDTGPSRNISSVVCNYMVLPANSTTTPYQNFLQLYASENGSQYCANMNYTSYIEYLQTVTSASRSWTWQTCNEFGFMMTDDAKDQPFGHFVTLKYDEQLCRDIFQIPNMMPKVNFTNAYYGGADIVTTNTFFTQGSLDPWHALGNKQLYVNGSLSHNANVMIQGTAHCADFQGPEPWDPPQLTAVRAEQLQMIGVWLSEDRAAKEAAKMAAATSIAME